MDDSFTFIFILVFLCISGFGMFMLGTEVGKDGVYKENFERGHMVQCVGRTGYYWEC